MLIGFPGQLLVPWLRLWTRAPIVFDPFVSLYDTLALDRRLFGPRSIPGRLSYALDRESCRRADHLLFDTQAHRDYFVQTFGLPLSKTSVVYVGCDEAHFSPRPAPPPTGTFEVFTYTSFLRLHGVEHILHAAKLLADRDDVRFTIAGAGARLAEMQRLARDLDLPNVRFPGLGRFRRPAGADRASGPVPGGALLRRAQGRARHRHQDLPVPGHGPADRRRRQPRQPRGAGSTASTPTCAPWPTPPPWPPPSSPCATTPINVAASPRAAWPSTASASPSRPPPAPSRRYWTAYSPSLLVILSAAKNLPLR